MKLDTYKMLFQGLFLLLLCLWFPCCKHVDPSLTASEDKKPNIQAVLGGGDVIEVRLFDEGELSGTHQISSNGTIRLPLVGSLKISGLTPEEAATLIASEYQKAYVKQPQVSVFVQEFNSRKVYVLGEVRNPGPYPFEENMTIIAAIAKAGGTTPMAASNRTVVSRENGGKQTREIARVADIGKGEAPDTELHPGDIVFVPESIF